MMLRWRMLFVLIAVFCFSARSAEPAQDILDASGVMGGLVIHLGCGDGKLTAELQANKSYRVQGLESDPVKVAAARKHIRSLGLYGPVSVRQWEGVTLPYGDDLVNLVVVSGSNIQISAREIERILAPRGVALIPGATMNPPPRLTVAAMAKAKRLRSESAAPLKGWSMYVKEVPTETDEWTHFLHSADNNAVARDSRVRPPRGLQWSAGPLWGRSHEFNNSFPAMVTAQGRVFYVLDKGVTGMEDPRLPEKWTLMARDAHNGTLLWERPLPTWGTHAWRQRALRFFGGTIARRLVVDEDNLYCTFDFGGDVQILDPATGETRSAIPQTAPTREILVSGDQVFCVARDQGGMRIVCWDRRKKQVVWNTRTGQIRDQLMAVGAEEIVSVEGDRILCRNRTDGSVRWPKKSSAAKTKGRKPGRGGRYAMLLIAGDLAIATGGGECLALSLADGKELWKRGGAGGRSLRNHDAFVVDGHLWVASGNSNIMGIDLKTGKTSSTVDAKSVQSEGHHLRCYRAKATDSYVISQWRGIEFLSLTGEEHSQQDWVRGTCTYGVMPANGYLYVPPHPCFCFPGAMQRGFNAFVGERQDGKDQPGPVEKGPSFSDLAPVSPQREPGAWPAYRHDSMRSGGTRTPGPKSLKRSWSVDLGTKLTPAVAAGGRLYLAAKERHTVHAFRAEDGKALWVFTTDARIDSPPTIYGERVLFGCTDGNLYCLSARDGALAWRRRLAPAERWMVVDGQPESVWPLHGSVVIKDGLVYCIAGRSSFLDGGLRLFAVEIATGEIKHGARLHTASNVREPGAKDIFLPAYHIEGAHTDLLVAEGDSIFLGQYKFSADLKLQPLRYLSKEEAIARTAINLDNKDYVNEDIFKVRWRNTTYDSYDKLTTIIVDEARNVGVHDVGLHLFTTSGFLDDSYYSRSFWMYSKTWPGFNMSILAPKSGQLVVIGPENTYALKAFTSRYPLSPSYNVQTKGYQLVADRNDNEPTMDPRAWNKDKGMGFSRSAPPVWNQWIPVRVKAMLLAGEELYVCGPPDVFNEKDPLAPFEGQMGSELRSISTKDGKTTTTLKLKETPIFDGLMAANGRLFMSCRDGTVICFGP